MRFIADSMLGRLCRWMRILGFPCAYVKSFERDFSLLKFLASAEETLLLTRDASLAAAMGKKAVFLKSQNWRLQLVQVLEETGLEPKDDAFFSRCVECGAGLEKCDPDIFPVPKKIPRLLPLSRCPECRRIFWRGSHESLARKTLGEILNARKKRKNKL